MDFKYLEEHIGKKCIKLTDEETLQYLDYLNIDSDDYRCRDCRKLVQWKEPCQYVLSPNKKYNKFGLLSLSKHSKYSSILREPRVYNNHEYHLHYCYDCACKRFPEIKDKKFPLSPASNRSKFLFEINDDDFKAITNNVCLRTKDFYINKFGLEKGQEKWNNYCQKQSLTNMFEYKHLKFGWSEEQFRNYNKSRACTLDNFKKRYGEEIGLQKWDNYIERQRFTMSVDYFIQEYGKEEGLEKYINFCNARYNAGGNSHSMICDEFCSELVKYFPDNKIICNYSTGYEKMIDTKYFVDYYDETLNIVVEFYGDYWHGNPLYFSENQKLFNNLTVKEKRQMDADRIKFIEKYLDTKVFIIWETDYRKNKNCVQELVNKIMFLNDNVNLNNL